MLDTDNAVPCVVLFVSLRPLLCPLFPRKGHPSPARHYTLLPAFQKQGLVLSLIRSSTTSALPWVLVSHLGKLPFLFPAF